MVGGSKSAADAAIHLDRAGADVTWLARKFYRFAPFDARTSVPLAHVLAKLPAMAARWSAEPLFTLEVLDGDAESGGMGTGNMLDESEHAAARRIKKVRGEAREISKEERKAAGRDKIPVIALRDGRRLPAELVVLATGYRKAHTALETCAASRRIVREMPKGKDSGLITTFGAINFHLLARGMCAWIERGMPAEFATWFGATYARSPSLKAYQLRYLATDRALAREHGGYRGGRRKRRRRRAHRRRRAAADCRRAAPQMTKMPRTKRRPTATTETRASPRWDFVRSSIVRHGIRSFRYFLYPGRSGCALTCGVKSGPAFTSLMWPRAEAAVTSSQMKSMPTSVAPRTRAHLLHMAMSVGFTKPAESIDTQYCSRRATHPGSSPIPRMRVPSRNAHLQSSYGRFPC